MQIKGSLMARNSSFDNKLFCENIKARNERETVQEGHSGSCNYGRKSIPRYTHDHSAKNIEFHTAEICN